MSKGNYSTLFWLIVIGILLLIFGTFYYVINKLSPSVQKVIGMIDELDQEKPRLQSVFNDIEKVMPEIRESIEELKQEKPRIKQLYNTAEKVLSDAASLTAVNKDLFVPMILQEVVPKMGRIVTKTNKAIGTINRAIPVITSSITDATSGLRRIPVVGGYFGSSSYKPLTPEQEEEKARQERQRELEQEQIEEEEDRLQGQTLVKEYQQNLELQKQLQQNLLEEKRKSVGIPFEYFYYPLEKPLPLPSAPKLTMFSIV